MLLATLVLALAGGCRLKDQSPPPLTGPSEFGMSVTLTANPDQLTQDGASQSRIEARVRDQNGQAKDVDLKFELVCTTADGLAYADYGSLSARDMHADNGTAVVTYTAPTVTHPAASMCLGQGVFVFVTPIGTDFSNSYARDVQIRLVPPGIILPPNGAPTAAFTFTPTAPKQGDPVAFDASTSADIDGVIVKYSWDFGDGSSAEGKFATHTFDASQSSFVVTLTVEDNGGQTASVAKAVSFTAAVAPTASFVFSPSAPAIGTMVFFDAAASKAGLGRRIVSYDWNFGDGSARGSGGASSHAYDFAGKYTVVLVVTDDLGNRGVATVEVEITP